MRGNLQGRGFTAESNAGGQKEIIRQYMSANGDGTGTANFTGNYLGSQARPYIAPPAGQVYRLTSLIYSLKDAGANGLEPNDLGYDASGISPGWVLLAERGVVTLHDYTLISMTRNSYLGFNNGAEDYLNLQLADAATALISEFALISKGQALRLDGDQSDTLSVYLDADYRTLQAQSWFVSGYIE